MLLFIHMFNKYFSVTTVCKTVQHKNICIIDVSAKLELCEEGNKCFEKYGIINMAYTSLGPT